MKIKFFTIPITSFSDFEKELNSFLSTNKIIEFEKSIVQNENLSYWCIFIKYEEKNTNSKEDSYKKKQKIDYLKVLPPEEAKLFEQLRTIRKEIAKEDAVSAFVVATNEELSKIAKLKSITLSNIKKVKGFGDKKVEKYGKRIIEKLNNLLNAK